MGYTRERKTYKLVFEDEEFAGLEVVCKGGSMRQYLDISKLAKLHLERFASGKNVDEINNLYTTFGKVLVSWNYEEPEGHPVPATAESLRDMDWDFSLAIILAWLDAVGGVSAPLGETSNSGDRSLEESLPMEVSSPSP